MNRNLSWSACYSGDPIPESLQPGGWTMPARRPRRNPRYLTTRPTNYRRPG